MKLNRLPFTFLFMVLACLMPLAVGAQQSESYTKGAGRASATIVNETYQYKFTEADFADTPLWKDGDGEPPISVIRAIKIARENLPRFIKGAEAWKFRGLTFQNMLDDTWFYRVNFTCARTQCRTSAERMFMVIVKMDGTMIEPKKVTIEN